MTLTQEEYIEIKLNLECVAMGGFCSALVFDSAGQPYILLSIHPATGISAEDAAMRALMECYRSCERFSWAKQVVLSQNIAAKAYRVARVSFSRSGHFTPYERVYERIAWQQRKDFFLPGESDSELDSIPLSTPWINK